MVTPKQVETFLKNPENFLYATDWREGVFRFVPAGREALSSLSFLDNRTLGQSQRQGSLPFEKVIPLAKGFQGRCDFIFHSAFCCSTLIARCLEQPGRVLALKEPLAILNLSGLRRETPGKDRGKFPRLAETTLRLLARPFSEGERILVKPSNGANNLIPEIFEIPGCGKVLLLFGPLEDFLVSVITGGEDRQKFIDGILPLFIKDFGAGKKIPDPADLSPLERAALAWGLQTDHFAKIGKKRPGQNLKFLNAREFLENPEKVLTSLNTYFGFGYSKKEMRKILSGPILNTHAKETHRIFNFKDREIERKEVLESHKKNIEAAKERLEKIGLANPQFDRTARVRDGKK